MQLLGFLSERDFEIMVHLNMIVDYPVTFDKVKKAKLVFGPDITSLKVKSVRHELAGVITNYVEIAREILDSCRDLEVLTENMFINKLPFLASISLGLKFTTT